MVSARRPWSGCQPMIAATMLCSLFSLIPAGVRAAG